MKNDHLVKAAMSGHLIRRQGVGGRNETANVGRWRGFEDICPLDGRRGSPKVITMACKWYRRRVDVIPGTGLLMVQGRVDISHEAHT